MTDVEKMVAQLDELIQSTDLLTTWSQEVFELRHNYTRAQTLATRMEAAIERVSPPGSAYFKEMEKARTVGLQDRVDIVRSTVIALRDDLRAGYLSTIVELVHADLYSDYLEMADGLLGTRHKDAAAVITGTSLEVHVRALCVKHGVDIEQPNGAPKKADVMNADLKRAGVYETLQQKHITAWMDLRNKAAHGDYSAYDEHQVRLFIDGVRGFMLKYPA
ncbi:hypothetical protein ACIGXA_17365 [Streptomyces fildesensis]|uniref:DUF4145 domain-containing protein n=1 Tax=Streptomyces fildesensis TaxID=375757 RepID=A0ABW8C783_9ACTN